MSSRSGGSKKNVKGEKVIADNRKANYLFSIEEIFEAGLVLVGSEVKSLRMNKANIAESYASEEEGEIFLINSNIPAYKNAIFTNHKPKRKRKLLLHSREINKLKNAIIDIVKDTAASIKYNNPVKNSFIYKFIRTQLKKLSA